MESVDKKAKAVIAKFYPEKNSEWIDAQWGRVINNIDDDPSWDVAAELLFAEFGIETE